MKLFVEVLALYARRPTVFAYLEEAGERRLRERAKTLKPDVLGAECNLFSLHEEHGDFRIVFDLATPTTKRGGP